MFDCGIFGGEGGWEKVRLGLGLGLGVGLGLGLGVRFRVRVRVRVFSKIMEIKVAEINVYKN